MAKLVNSCFDLANCGVELAAVLVAGFAPVAPILKLFLSTVPLTIEVVWHFPRQISKIGESHE